MMIFVPINFIGFATRLHILLYSGGSDERFPLQVNHIIIIIILKVIDYSVITKHISFREKEIMIKVLRCVASGSRYIQVLL